MNDWRIIVILALIAIYVGLDTVKDNNDRDSIQRLEQRVSDKEACAWGASSVVAYIGKDGKVHQSKPAVTGCTP